MIFSKIVYLSFEEKVIVYLAEVWFCGFEKLNEVLGHELDV